MTTQQINPGTWEIMSRYDICYLSEATDDQLTGIYAASLVDLDEARDQSRRLEVEIRRRMERAEAANSTARVGSASPKYPTAMTSPNLVDCQASD